MESVWLSLITFCAGVLVTIIGALLRERRQWIEHRFESHSKEAIELVEALEALEKRLYAEIKDLRSDQGNVWRDMGGKVSRGEIDELRGEMNAGFERIHAVLRSLFRPIRAQLSDLYRIMAGEGSDLVGSASDVQVLDEGPEAGGSEASASEAGASEAGGLVGPKPIPRGPVPPDPIPSVDDQLRIAREEQENGDEDEGGAFGEGEGGSGDAAGQRSDDA